ncbi:two-component sensor histidine kinase [Methylogaea oryzae]|uniref:histidine kinase n=1 Tax=Methylogaea oryzae TaxID=1295382 RepID=A0A8D4VU87_9GAMM|nr:two-component sensor histidine kinase [Methylogaea oryzae]
MGLGVAAALAVILGSLHLMTSAMQHSSQLSGWYSAMVGINTLGTLLLLGLVGVNGYWLYKQLRQREAGSRLTARMAVLFILLTLAPASVVFYSSMQFLHESIDSWFDTEIDRAMEDALELGQAVLGERTRALVEASEQIAESVAGTPEAMTALHLDELREQAGATELTLFGKQARIVASSSMQPGLIVPSLPNESLLLHLKEHQPYVGMEPVPDSTEPCVEPCRKGQAASLPNLRVRVISRLATPDALYLQALYSIPPRIGALAESVEAAFGHYREMNYLRGALKLTFSLGLSLVLLMSLLAAIWAAFISIRRIVAPVRELALATRKVADGDYAQRLPVQSEDELGFLVESFNEMTRRIALAHEEAQRSQLEVEHQRAYLETILSNLSSGVVSFDALMRVRTANQAANNILNADLGACAGHSLASLAEAYPNLAGWVEAVQARLQHTKSVWQEEIAFVGPNGRQELFCRGTPLFSAWGYWSGAVVVFDDVTALIQAQRTALWSEMARRLAHEIKNPLTPIQLSAERLRHKLAKSLNEADAQVLEKSTRTIVQQVEAMKTMVNAFNDYARPSKVQPVALDLAELVEEVAALYPAASGLKIDVCATGPLPRVKADPVHMRQVLHNLIKNAQEAGGGDEAATRVEIALRSVEDAPGYLEISVRDNGPGIAPEYLERVFEPYVTSKTKGTGLGLAVVRKIIEEHGGGIRIDSRYKAGAGFIIRLPLAEPVLAADRRDEQ